MFHLGQHLRAAWRLVRCHPWFVLALGASIAISSGFTGTTLTLANALTAPSVSGPSHPAGLVAIYRRSPAGDYQHATVRDLEAVRTAHDGLTAVGGASPANVATIRMGQEFFEARLATVRGGLFEALSMTSSEGRLLTAADGAPATGPAPIVVSRAFQDRAFGGDAHLGALVIVNGVEHTIVGVAPAGFDGFELGRPTEAWVPAGDPAGDARALSGELIIVARLGPGRAVSDLRGRLPSLEPVPFSRIDPAYRARLAPIALTLVLAGTMVLAAGAVSVAALLISRNAARLDEIGARAALGATSARLTVQLAVESAAVAAGACLFAAIFAFWTLRLLLASLAPEQADVLRVHLGFFRLAGMSASFLLIWVPIGLACAHYVCKATPVLLRRSAGSLRDSPIGVTVQRRLLVVQTGLACALLITVVLLTRGFDQVLTAGLGRTAQKIAIVSLMSPGGRLDVARGTQFQHAALERISRIPGVLAVAWASTLPLVEGPRTELSTTAGGSSGAYRTIAVSSSYFQTMQLDVVAGRFFNAAEEIPYTPDVIVNATLAGRVFPEGIVGAQFVDSSGAAHPLVGVVSDDRYRQMEAHAEPTVYRPLASEYTAFLHLVVRAAIDSEVLMPTIRTALDSIDEADVSRAESLEAHLAGALGRDRVAVTLVRACGLLVILLSLSGAYLLSESIADRRRREMAVRLALGSSRRRLIASMIERALGPTVIGVGVGAVCAYALTPVFHEVVGRLSAADALIFGEVAAIVVGLSLVATAIPAVLAARSISPIAVLR